LERRAVPAESTKPTGRTYLAARHVRRRYGVSDMSLWRWLRDPALGFPQPLRIRGRRYWDAALLEAWDARPAGASASAGETTPTLGHDLCGDAAHLPATQAGLAALVELARSAEGRDLLLRLVQIAGAGEGAGKSGTTIGAAIDNAAVPARGAVVGPSVRSALNEASLQDQPPRASFRARRGRGLPR
jgi:predicted DNA-binding transcriptional regulator AlpA